MGERNDISIEAFGDRSGDPDLADEEHSSSIGLFQKYLNDRSFFKYS